MSERDDAVEALVLAYRDKLQEALRSGGVYNPSHMFRSAIEAGIKLGEEREQQRQERAALPRLPPGLFAEYGRLDAAWQTLVRERDDAVRALDAAVRAEREACASLIEGHGLARELGDEWWISVDEAVSSIRARGKADKP